MPITKHDLLDIPDADRQFLSSTATDWYSRQQETAQATAEPADESGDTSRGFKRAFAQVPELGYGAAALAAMSTENLFGEGGLSTNAKNYFAGKYAEKAAENRQFAPTVDFDTAVENAKAGDYSSLADWLQDTAGYVVGQGLQTVATFGAGALAGKVALTGATQKFLGGMVAKEASKLAAKGIAMPAATRAAASGIAANIAAGTALVGQNVGMEAGDIYGGLIEQSSKTGKEITGGDLARAWGMALAAAGTETATDLLGIGALTGKIKIPFVERSGIKGRLARGAVAGAIGAPVEGGQEWVQTYLEQIGAGKPTDTAEAQKERREALAVGAVGGTLMGGGAGALSRQSSMAKPQAEIQQAEITETDQKTQDAAMLAALGAEPSIAKPIDHEADAASILSKQSIDDAIAESTSGIDEFGALLKSEQIDVAFRRNQAIADATKAADYRRAIAQAAETQAEQADAMTRVQGFDEATPTAMQVAFQRAQEVPAQDVQQSQTEEADKEILSLTTSRRGSHVITGDADTIRAAEQSIRKSLPGVAIIPQRLPNGGYSLVVQKSANPEQVQAVLDTINQGTINVGLPTAPAEMAETPDHAEPDVRARGDGIPVGTGIGQAEPGRGVRIAEAPAPSGPKPVSVRAAGEPSKALVSQPLVADAASKGSASWLKEPISTLIRRNRIADQIGKRDALDKAVSKAKALMDGTGNTGYLWFVAKAKEFRKANDTETADILDGIAARMKAERKAAPEAAKNEEPRSTTPVAESQAPATSEPGYAGVAPGHEGAAPQQPIKPESEVFSIDAARRTLVDALAEMGFYIDSEKGSELSGSRYVYATAPNGDALRVRVSDHDLPPTYEAMNGAADIEIGPHDMGTYEEDAIVTIAKRYGVVAPQWAVDTVSRVEESRRVRRDAEAEQGRRYLSEQAAIAEWLRVNDPDYDSRSTNSKKRARQRAREALGLRGGTESPNQSTRTQGADTQEPQSEVDKSKQPATTPLTKKADKESQPARPYATSDERDEAIERLTKQASERGLNQLRDIRESAEYGASESEIAAAIEQGEDALDDLANKAFKRNNGLKHGFGQGNNDAALIAKSKPLTERENKVNSLTGRGLYEMPEADRASLLKMAKARSVDAFEGLAISDRRAVIEKWLDTQEPAQSKQSAITAIKQSDLSPSDKLSTITALNKGDIDPNDVRDVVGVKEEAKPETEPSKAKISDMGEKIGGARKDVWTSYKDKLADAGEVDIKAEPLSKSWPAPDYEAMLEAGADPWSIAFMHAARDEIPTKPSSPWKLSGWVEKVKTLREFATGLTDGTVSVEKARLAIANTQALSDIASRVDLYMAVGHSKSLRGIRMTAHGYSLYRGVEYNPAKVLWVVEQKAKATAFSNWPRELAIGDTKEEALAKFKERFSALDIDKPASKETKFEIYSARGEKGYRIGKKMGRNPILLTDSFATVKEAREYMREHQDELVKKLEDAKKIPNVRRDTNEPRVGEDMRDGQDVTPQMFMDAFGFRGVEFGNWVEQKKRQKDLNEAYDALMDMAAIIGVKPKALSLNGELGLAFGARGTGGIDPAKAHYEPGFVVINLTKKAGAGSLGHEWWHALDNYFSRMRGKKADYTTEALDVSLARRGSEFIANTAVRKEMIEAFGVVMRAIHSTALKARSAKLDAKRNKEYWTTGPEMSARAYESYLISKLQDQDASNDYLANIVDEKTWAAAEKIGFELDESYPYPTAGEVPAIRAAFDNFFQTIETKETDTGTALFSRSQGDDRGIDMRDAEATINRVSAGYKNLPPIVTLANPNSLKGSYDELHDYINKEGAANDVEAAFHDGKIYVFTDNISSAERLEHVLFNHELGHYGLRGVFGPDLDPLLDYIRSKSLKVQFEANKKKRQYSTRSMIEAVEEVIVDMNPADLAKLKGWQKVVLYVRDWLASHGFTEMANRINAALEKRLGSEQVADLMVADMVTRAREWARSGKQTRATRIYMGVTRLSDVPGVQFYSQLSKAVEQAPDRVFGTASQFKLWLLANAGKLGVKKDEITWSGIEDFLDMQGKGKVSRADVVGFLSENAVRVEDVVLGEKYRVSLTSGTETFDTYAEAEQRLADEKSWIDDESVNVYADEDDGYISITDHENEEIEYINKNEDGGWYVESRGGYTLRGYERREFDSFDEAEEYANELANDVREGWHNQLSDKPEAKEADDSAKFASYIPPGGIPGTYREILVTLPQKSKPRSFADWQKRMDAKYGVSANVLMTSEEMAEGNRLRNNYDSDNNDFKSSHFDQPNILVHLRTDEVIGADGKRYLRVVELQSDWGQQRKKEDAMRAKGVEDGGAGAPAGPFIGKTEAWVSLGIKRAIQHAVSSGVDGIVFATGQQNADLYDLSKSVDEVSASKEKNGEYSVAIKEKDQRTPRWIGNFKESELSEQVGKELAEKIIKDGGGRFTGLDLQVGGEGMRSFYDTIVPSVANDVLKKLGGGKVGVVELTIPVEMPSTSAGDLARADRLRATLAGQPLDRANQPGFLIPESLKAKVQTEGLPLFSKRGEDAMRKAPPKETRPQTAQRIWQDKFNRFRVLQDWLNEQGVNLSEEADVYLAETTMHGRIAARKQDFRERVMAPLIEKTQRAGIGLEEIGDFLKMQHAKEANERIRKIHQDETATAYGVTDEEAKAAMDEYRRRPDYNELKEISDEWRAVTGQSKEILLNAGIISDDMAKAWESSYELYVPVKGRETKQGVGKGLDVKGKQKRRMGHSLRDEAILENIWRDYERAVTLDEHNLVGKSLIQFALEAKNPDIVTVDKPVKRQVLRPGESKYVVTFNESDVAVFDNKNDAYRYVSEEVAKYGREKSEFDVVKTGDPARVIMQASPLLADNEANVYIGGHAVRVQINDEIAAREYKNMGVEHLGAILAAGRTANSWLSKAYTGWSPDFIFTNPIRDATQGAVTLTGNYGIEIAGKVFSNYPMAVKELVKHFRNPGSSKIVNDYRAHGGSTGAAYLSDIERIGEDMQAAYNEYAGVLDTYNRVYQQAIDGGKSKSTAASLAALKSGIAGFKEIPVIGHFIKLIERINSITENALRVATYQTLVENNLVSKKKAAAQAKNLMNFNRKGEMSNVAGAMYLFFNPNVQGTQVMYHALMGSEHKGQARALAGMMVLSAIALASLARGGGDDDEERWKNTPDYIKDGNLIFGFGDKQVMLPLPYGYRIFHTLGNVMSDYAHGEDGYKLGIRLATSAFQQFSPVGNPMEGEVAGFQLLPTLPKMALGPSVNENAFGREIMPKRYSEAKPDSQLMYRGTKGSLYSGIAEGMNEFTGGSRYERGLIDVSPETLKYWVRSLTGGAGQFAADAINTPVMISQGVPPKTRDLPIVRRFIRDAGNVSDIRNAFWERANEAKKAADAFAGARKAGDVASMKDIWNEDGELISLSRFANSLQDEIKAKRDMIDVVRNDEKLTLAQKHEQMKLLEAQESAIYQRFIKAFDKQAK